MDEAFWQRRWARNEIGFHLNEVNPYLRRHWPSLKLAQGARVLVPLCGKSLDMAWLADQVQVLEPGTLAPVIYLLPLEQA